MITQEGREKEGEGRTLGERSRVAFDDDDDE